jgi:excisionase family DNA binding protein
MKSLAEGGFDNAASAARFLGVSKTTIYTLARAGVLTYAIIGGRKVFPHKSLVDYAAAQMRLGSVA